MASENVTSKIVLSWKQIKPQQNKTKQPPWQTKTTWIVQNTVRKLLAK